MQQIIRKGIKDILVEDVPDPIAGAHHVLIRPVFSLISSGTETASIHQEGVLKEVADNPSHIRKVLDVMKINGPVSTVREVYAKFSEYAALGYAGAGILVEKHRTVTDLELGDRVAYGGEGTGHAETIITGRNLVARVPQNVPLDQACFATLGSIALNAVRIANISLGDRVAIIGLGLVGSLNSVSAYSLPTGKQDPVGENNMVASFRFADGSIGTLNYSTIGSKTSGGERVEVFMQGLGLLTEDFKKLTTAGGIRQTKKKMFAEKGYDAQIEDFISDLRKGNAPKVTVRDGVRSTIGCLRMLQSARELQPMVTDWERVIA